MPPDPPIDVAEHIGLVVDIARRFVLQGHDVRDSEAFGDGLLGLVLAARRFDPGIQEEFPRYAGATIRGMILNGFRARHIGRKPGRSRELTFHPDMEAEQDGTVFPGILQDSRTAEWAEIRDLAGWLLDGLDRRERRLVERVVMLGWTNQEAGAAEPVPVSHETARQVVKMAMGKLRWRARALDVDQD